MTFLFRRCVAYLSLHSFPTRRSSDLVNILLLVVGAILEPTAAILIMVPVLAPIADIFGIDGTHFAVMVIFNLMIGLLTPPVGLVLFVLSSVTQIPVTRVIRGVLPFFVPM